MNDPSTRDKFKILAADRANPIDYFDTKAAEIGAEVVYGGAERAEQIESMVGDVDAVIVFRTDVTARAISKMERCKLILRQGIGVDLIDVPAATRAGIFVSNIPDYCVEEVATHAMALMLASVRNLMDYHRVAVEKGWGFYNTSRKIPALDQQTLGIVGLGKIGRSVARKAHAFGMTLIAYDPYLHQDIYDGVGAERIRDLDELLQRSNVISLHIPLTPETRGMFGAREFQMMKPGSHFINTARGKIVDMTALEAALSDGPLAAAGIDVFEDEPMDPAHPLLARPNLIATPHVAFYSERSLGAIVTEAMDEVVRTLSGERPRNLVNPEAYAHRS